MVHVSDSDIQIAEKVLLPDGCTFNDERVDFIQCMESRDVVACPGSGKTTALLAKLLILASQMPFKDNRGICVLTHTNVAIDEIKARLGANSEHLFRPPNFFGTIQSFVNRFLATPFYRNEFKQNVHSIDWEMYTAEISKKYRTNMWLEPRGGVSTLASYWFNPQDLSIQKDLDSQISGLGKHTPTYKYLCGIRTDVLRRGYLSYNDAYSLSLRYIEKYPSVTKALHHRFGFVFIDEMQDTDSHQLKVFDKVFENENCIIQCLGDPNQAIFGSRVKKDMVWKPIENPIHFSDTKRFGKTIAELLHTVRVDDQILLKENPNRNSLPPYMITYTDENIENVLPAFVRLIQNTNLHKEKTIKTPIFKAVGWIGKDKTEEGKLCLRYFFPEYRKSIKTRKEYFSNLLSYLYLASNKELKDKGAKVYKGAIMQGIIHAFDLGGIKNPDNNRRFASKSYLKWLRENKELTYLAFTSELSKWIISLHRKEQTPTQIRTIIANAIRKKSDIQMTDELENFLTSDTLEFSEAEQSTSNTFTSDNGMSVEVGTVHSVKGETHTATLYLETYYQSKTDSQRLLEFLKGNYPKKELAKAYHKENLKIAHVAFSRPTHLLAFACNEDSIKGSETDLANNGWEMKSVENLLTGC